MVSLVTMNPLFRCGLALVVAAFATTARASLAQSPPMPEVPETVAVDLRVAIDEWAVSPVHRGVSASVVFADGAQWRGTAGLAGPGEPLRSEHMLLIASITKTMTGALVPRSC